ncbi:MAG: hypothetical protein WBQ69_11625 [Gallionella sp.]
MHREIAWRKHLLSAFRCLRPRSFQLRIPGTCEFGILKFYNASPADSRNKVAALRHKETYNVSNTKFSGVTRIVKGKATVIVSVFIFILIVVLAGISSDWGIALLTRIFK